MSLTKDNDGIEKYISYLNENMDNVIEEVTDYFDKRRDKLAPVILERLRELADDDEIDKNISINDFLDLDIGGYKDGLYDKQGDWLADYTMQLGEKVMKDAIRDYLKKTFFNDDIDDDTLEEVIDECHDEIYDNCPAEQFFWAYAALEYCRVDLDVPLKSIFDDTKNI